MKMASLVLGTAADQYGCFVPDLTRFTELSCEGTRLSWHDKGKLIAFQNSIGS